MEYFNRNDHRYLTCCGQVHVSTLARVLMVLSIAGYSLACYYEVSTGVVSSLSGIPIVCLGVYGVFRERRSAIFVFIVLAITLTVVWMIRFQTEVAEILEEEGSYPPLNGLALPAVVCFCLFISSIQYFVYMTFWNLAKFIKHRDIALERQRCQNV
ncbi:hypothetical protein PMAYCL1PPCAC_22924 [Pristionchus mayeri]|uniref:Uncharacterized protein n=1 Tax=Pristionchus mayeri TaxID=1317129 RepID=A0AAN5CXY5_9BILA|nr:hypothetical protein PMAYCL1PPCAC_22924 [Pristionchus mayeri]